MKLSRIAFSEMGERSLARSRFWTRRRGFALAYVLLFITVLTAWFAAVMFRVHHSLLFNTLDQNRVRAEKLSQMGLDLGLTLFQRRGPDWYQDLGNPMSNRRFGAQFTDQALGGNFTIQVLDADQLTPNPFPADSGTFKVMIGVGQVNNRVCRSLMSFKLSNPFINYLSASPNFYGRTRIDGPVYVDSAPPLYMGDLRFAHSALNNRGGSVTTFDNFDVEVGGEIRAVHNVFVQNQDNTGSGNPPLRPPLPLSGIYQAGEVIQNLDTQANNPTNSQGGQIRFSRRTVIEPNVTYAVELPTMKQLLNQYQDPTDSSVITVPISSSAYPEGALLEFCDGKATLSKAGVKSVGRVFDRSLLLNFWGVGSGDLRNVMFERLSQDCPGNELNVALSEMRWDDPNMANAPAPAFLNGNFVAADGSSIQMNPGDSDYFPLSRIVRGGLSGSWNLSRNDWTIIRLVAQDCACPSADSLPRNVCPPVFLRGRVRGKVVVVYDSLESISPIEGTDPNKAVVPLIVLGDHEALDDSPALQLTTPPGVPGGVTLEDPNFKTTADSTGAFSEDYCLLISRDIVGSFSTNGNRLDWVCDAGGNRTNYRQILDGLDLAYTARYGSRYAAQRPKPDESHIPLEGIAIGRFSNLEGHPLPRKLVITADGRVLADGVSPGYYYNTLVSGPPLPNLRSLSDWAAFSQDFRYRYSMASSSALLDVRGGLHSTADTVGGKGVNLVYDYRWRSQDQQTLRKFIKLPVGPIVISRQ